MRVMHNGALRRCAYRPQLPLSEFKKRSSKTPHFGDIQEAWIRAAKKLYQAMVPILTAVQLSLLFTRSMIGTTPLVATAPMPGCSMKIFVGDSEEEVVAENVKIGDPLTLVIMIDNQGACGVPRWTLDTSTQSLNFLKSWMQILRRNSTLQTTVKSFHAQELFASSTSSVQSPFFRFTFRAPGRAGFRCALGQLVAFLFPFFRLWHWVASLGVVGVSNNCHIVFNRNYRIAQRHGKKTIINKKISFFEQDSCASCRK